LLVPVKVVPTLLISFILMMEAIGFSETSVLTRVAWPHIPEDGIFPKAIPLVQISAEIRL
jgi:hypothetical protein